MAPRRLIALALLVAASAACGDDGTPAADGGDDRPPADADHGDGDADADAADDAPAPCDRPPQPGVLADRVPPGAWPDLEWHDPFPGAWTTVDAAARGVAPDRGDVSGPLQTLIDGLDGPTIVQLPPGRYELHAPIAMRGELILRGAGSDATRFDLVGTHRAFTWEGVGGQWAWPWIDPEFGPREIQADVPVHADTIPLADTTGLQPGDRVMVAEPIDRPSFPSAQYARGGIFALTAVTPTAVTLDLPLTVGLHRRNAAGEPTVVSKLQPIGDGGIEHLAIAAAEP